MSWLTVSLRKIHGVFHTDLDNNCLNKKLKRKTLKKIDKFKFYLYAVHHNLVK